MFLPFTKTQIVQREAQIAQLENELAEAKSRAQALFQHGTRNAQKVGEYYSSFLAGNAEKTRGLLTSLPVSNIAAWSEQAWSSWNPTSASEDSIIRVGDMLEGRSQDTVIVPGYIPFIGQNKVIIIRSSGKTAAQGAALLQSLVIRTALMLPHQARYTLLDPAGAGVAFPMRRHLPHVRESGNDVRRDLDQVTTDIQRIIET